MEYSATDLPRLDISSFVCLLKEVHRELAGSDFVDAKNFASGGGLYDEFPGRQGAGGR